MPIEEIIIATGNTGKVREIGEIFAGHRVRFSSLKDHWPRVPHIPETAKTFLGNARMKAQWVFSRKGMWTLADDSGLEVDALGGMPGVLSARYAGPEASDEERLRKLLDALGDRDLSARRARFRCVMVLVGPGSEYVAEGSCEGVIAFEPQGSGGFGYDPVFVPDGYRETFAQLDPGSKHAISHRGRALRKLKEAVDELIA